jgi:hypothetical protein
MLETQTADGTLREGLLSCPAVRSMSTLGIGADERLNIAGRPSGLGSLETGPSGRGFLSFPQDGRRVHPRRLASGQPRGQGADPSEDQSGRGHADRVARSDAVEQGADEA